MPISDSYYKVVKKTPLELAKKQSKRLGFSVYYKREDLQDVKSFKIRGAYNKMSQLSEEEKSAGVIAASAGNHAQGVASSAQTLGIPATIVMPTTTPKIKIEAVQGYGATVILHGDSYSDAGIHAKTLQKQNGMTYVHPFDDPVVIEGQGMVGDEIVYDLPSVTHIFIPIGGGGLAAGIAQNLKLSHPNIRIIGVEPDDSNAMQQSVAAKKRVALPEVGIFADGVAVKLVGEKTFEIISKFVDELVVVDTDTICSAVKTIYEDTRTIVEPAGALAAAAVEQYGTSHDMKDTVCVAINSGANMTFERLQFIAERTLSGSGLEGLYAVVLDERVGALKELLEKAVNGFSISEFNYRKQTTEKARIFVGITFDKIENKSDFEELLKELQYEYVDLTDDELAKRHLRHMVGGKAPKGLRENIKEYQFPERPGALLEFLESTVKDRNITLFHYRYNGGDVANVLVGIEAQEDEEVKARRELFL